MSRLLLLNKINKYYSINSVSMQVLQDIDLLVEKGESLALVGESGSGKTTLSRIILGLTQPDSGDISWGDNEIRPKLSAVFQNPKDAMNPRKRIWESIAEPLIINEKKRVNYFREKCLRIASEVGLEKNLIDRFPFELSGGQIQRAVIARALIVMPDLIILDEPTSALDISVQAKIINLLTDLQIEYNLTYIFITHDLQLVHYLAKKIFVLKNGKCVEKGEIKDVFSKPNNLYTRKLLEAGGVINIP